jgi:hypothetical protein
VPGLAALARKEIRVSNRDDLIKVLRGERPERIPCISYGFWDEKSMHKLAPADCYDEDTLCTPSDDPPRDRFSPEPRSRAGRERAVRMAAHLDSAKIGVGKGGAITFGHGGPGEIQPVVEERTAERKILLYEGGHRRMVHYNPHSVRYYDFPVREEGDLERLELPDMGDPKRFQDVEEDCRFFREAGYAPTGAIQGFFSGIHNSFMDFPEVLVNLLAEPRFMKRLTGRLAGMSLQAVEMMLARGVEIIDVCDDLGNADGLLISPALFREFFLPWYEELAHRVHRRGGWVHMHSHGNIRPIIGDLAGAGIDILNPFDWHENPDLPGLVRELGRRVVFCGGSVGNLYGCSLEEVERITRRACRLARLAERGYIFMGNPGLDSLSREEWDAWRRIFRTAREEGRPG